jgi:hypothetical protein
MAGGFSGAGVLTIYDPATQYTTDRDILYPGQREARPHARVSFVSRCRYTRQQASSRLDQFAVATPYWPKPNGSGSLSGSGLVQNNYTYTAQSCPFIRYFGRLDYQIKSNNRLSMSINDGDNPGQGFGAGICPINCQSQDVSKVNSQISDVWSFGPRVTNEVRMGYTNQLNFFSPLTAGLGYPAKIGLKFAKADTFPTFNFQSVLWQHVIASINAVYKEQPLIPPML